MGGLLRGYQRKPYQEYQLKSSYNDVLLIGTKDQTIVGRPLIPNAKVIATVEEQTRDKKLIVFKKKKRKGYKKKQGHRSYITVLRINDIVNDNE